MLLKCVSLGCFILYDVPEAQLIKLGPNKAGMNDRTNSGFDLIPSSGCKLSWERYVNVEYEQH